MRMAGLVSALFVWCVAALPAPVAAQRAPQTGAPANWPLPVHDARVFTFVQADRLEGQTGGPDGGYLWDVHGWVGTDMNKFWGKLRGDGLGQGGVQAAEIQGLYSRTISPFFNLQTGIRQDVTPHVRRTYAVLGMEGLAPYWFRLDGALFLSNTGDVTARLEAEYELLLTQRLILQPRAEVNGAFQDVTALSLGSGLSSTELGVRLRYEIRREVAPYLGVSWERSIGRTADLVRAGGGAVGRTSFVAGVRLWH